MVLLCSSLRESLSLDFPQLSEQIGFYGKIGKKSRIGTIMIVNQTKGASFLVISCEINFGLEQVLDKNK